MDVSLPEIIRLVSAANAERWQRERGEPIEEAGGEAERELNELFASNQTLAVYGTLAPGQPNHHVVAPLGGEWTGGFVEGDLLPVGWGAAVGYPAFRPRGDGDAVPVRILHSPMLAAAWPALDRFEGVEYRRILVPVFKSGPAQERQLHTVANIYAVAEDVSAR